jgi:hypothetical protein
MLAAMQRGAIGSGDQLVGGDGEEIFEIPGQRQLPEQLDRLREAALPIGAVAASSIRL